MKTDSHQAEVVQVMRPEARSAIVLVCEHASHQIPPELADLGLDAEAQRSHIAWDPGAFSVAQVMSEKLDAVLVASNVSRLVYDCNRPPDASDAMPVQSETYHVPGNVGLTEDAKAARVRRYYAPFRDALSAEVKRRKDPVLVTIHSFTPVYRTEKRDVEVGILHDQDARLADAMLDCADQYDVRRNTPYGPEDGVTHTLKEHGQKHGYLNVMIEVRNDLIADRASQVSMAKTLVNWLTKALESLGADTCRA